METFEVVSYQRNVSNKEENAANAGKSHLNLIQDMLMVAFLDVRAVERDTYKLGESKRKLDDSCARTDAPSCEVQSTCNCAVREHSSSESGEALGTRTNKWKTT